MGNRGGRRSRGAAATGMRRALVVAAAHDRGGVQRQRRHRYGDRWHGRPPPSATTTDDATADRAASTDPVDTDAPDTTVAEIAASPADAETVAAIEAAIGAGPAGCDPLDTRQCLLPFPSDAYLVDDAATDDRQPGEHPRRRAAGQRRAGSRSIPASGTCTTASARTRSLLTYVADLDPTNLPTWTDLGASLDDDATVVLVDIATGERIPLWAEPDVGAENPEERLLVIHPAISLAPATTYAVGLQGLDTDGRRTDRRVARLRAPTATTSRPRSTRSSRAATTWSRRSTRSATGGVDARRTCSSPGRSRPPAPRTPRAASSRSATRRWSRSATRHRSSRSPRSTRRPRTTASPGSSKAPTASPTT